VKFEKGDLVRIKEDTAVYDMLESASNVGIVVSSAILMLIHIYENGDKKEFWAYDIIVDGRKYKNIPEEVLEEFCKNEEDFE
jgi:hypothetical protein